MMVLKLTEDSLVFVRDDCTAALCANPLGHKAEEYLATARACQAELNRREQEAIQKRIIEQAERQAEYDGRMAIQAAEQIARSY